MKLVYRGVSCIGLILVLYFCFTQIWLYSNSEREISRNFSSKVLVKNRERLVNNGPRYNVVVCAVVCGDRTQETLVMVKSAILFSSSISLRIIIVTESDLIPTFEEKLLEWRSLVNNSFVFEIKTVSFPADGQDQWRKLFKPCASQRLFLPSLLNEVDSVLYVDTDVIFLSPLETIWRHFDKMNSTQLAALSPEHEDPNTGWYNRFAKHPFYGPLGVNSGVMLMNLTRMREFQWESYLGPVLREYKTTITWGDQDIINIIFHYHPGRLYMWDCSYNYRSDHCVYSSVCSHAMQSGVHALHGSRAAFHSDRQPAFSAIFNTFQKYQLGSDPYDELLSPLESSLQQTELTNCGKIHTIFTKNLKYYLDSNSPD